MEPFTQHRGVAVPLLRPNIDTDAIIPSREMRQVSPQGLGAGLFAHWRYRDAARRIPEPDFPLNQDRYRGASILLAGDNFGCGSSREHAVWALREFGFRVVAAAGFGTIFAQNCVRNGILPLRLPAEQVQALVRAVAEDPGQRTLLVDLQAQCVTAPGPLRFAFAIDPAWRETLLRGLDPIARSLRHEAALAAFERRDRRRRAWAYLPRGD